MARQLYCWLVLVHAIAATSLVRIPLESEDHLSFTGAVHVGSPPQRARVVFDTGSSDAWVTSAFAFAVSGLSAGETITIGYGGGLVAGLAGRADLRLLGSDENELLLHDVHVGCVDDQTSVLLGVDAQGVVGFGMETLAQIHSNSSFLGTLASPVAFSLYISSSSGAQPSSQLSFGGDDPALTSPSTKWFTFPVASNDALRGAHPSSSSTKGTFGFWALPVQSVSFDKILLPSGGPDKHHIIALFDSGTSMLLLPPRVFDSVVQALVVRFGTRFLPPTKHQSLPACRLCRVNEFPPLAVEFLLDDGHSPDAKSQRFVLQGSDYVRCDQHRRECTAMIDFIHPSELSSDVDVVVLGTVFFRAYYARFDYTHKQVGLACTVDDNGVCPGGVQPALDYRGRPYESFEDRRQSSPSFVGLCAAATALALLAGLQMVL
ncbi:hypothetical protein KRP22_006646 [Phytophthora ramorum]|uniref:Pepsin A n=1 Tax=Phytophthora ramorum TaxID=164328 RepID=UPI0030AA68A3|nr:Pepsin A [Phytophthora ramorum]KAH7507117.1 Pepsin A [Phytophthora ramorum]